MDEFLGEFSYVFFLQMMGVSLKNREDTLPETNILVDGSEIPNNHRLDVFETRSK